MVSSSENPVEVNAARQIDAIAILARNDLLSVCMVGFLVIHVSKSEFRNSSATKRILAFDN